MEHKDNLLGVLETLFKWKRPILITTILAAVGSSVIVLLIPVFYKATTIFYVASPDLAKPERIFGTSNEAMDYYGDDEDIDRIMTLASSSELAQYLISTFDLYKHYRIDLSNAKAPFRVRERFDNLYKVQKTKFDAIELSVEDEDPTLSAAMANSARLRIDSIAQRLIKTSQAEVIKTYEANISEKEALLTILNDSLLQVRNRYGVYNTETQSELLATLLAKAEARNANVKARLESFRSQGNVRSDTLINLNAQVSATNEEVNILRDKLKLFNDGMALVDVLSELQREASEQLGQDQERYKQIKTAYQNQFPALHLVEKAAVPIVKSRPQRSILVLAATLAAFLFSVIGVLLFDTYKEVDWKKMVKG